MSVLKNFKNIPRSPYGGRHALNIIFFFKFTTRSLAGGARVQGGPVLPPPATGPPLGRPGGPTHRRDRGAVAPPFGRPALAILYKHSTLIPSSFEPKNSTKNPGKKRGEEKGSGEALPDCALVICRYRDGLLARPSYRLEPQVFLCSS